MKGGRRKVGVTELDGGRWEEEGGRKGEEREGVRGGSGRACGREEGRSKGAVMEEGGSREEGVRAGGREGM